GGGGAVEGGGVVERGGEGLDDLAELCFVQFLAVAGAGGARDVLVHERATKVVGTRTEGLTGAGDAHLHPRDLNVVDPAPVCDAGDGMDEQRFPERRPGAGSSLEEDRA